MHVVLADLSSIHLIIGVVILASILLSLLLILQSAHTLYIMLYTWDRQDQKSKVPEQFLPPQKSFTVMLPARHEEEVIQTTIERVVGANYPLDLLECIVICSVDDPGTIEEAQKKVDMLRAAGIEAARVVSFNDRPINKPHGLNVGLRSTSNEIVTIFDAEDDIHPDIFNIVNTIMLQDPSLQVLQCGVQLMNYESHWFSTLNVLEYFFWFKSRLHYHAKHRSITLGGNTVFFTRSVLERVEGWDEYNLSEDADIGIRISCLNEPVQVVYDDRYVTREETPPTLQQFIKQRTRWSQGFMQTLKKGDWQRLPTFGQRILAFYTLAFPSAQAILGMYVLASLGMMFTIKTPAGIAIILDMPFYLLLAHFLLSVIGLFEFTSAHKLKPSMKTLFIMAISYLPYQWVLSYAAMRAALRQLRGINNWEKTQHVGAHRQPAVTTADVPSP